MAWECVSCHRQITLDPDPRGCDDESICWHCLYEHREALLEACETLVAHHVFNTHQRGATDPPEEVDFLDALDAVEDAIKMVKGQQDTGTLASNT